MLEYLRKYTGIMMVALVLVFAGMIFIFDGSTSVSIGAGPEVARMEGKSFHQNDLAKAERMQNLAAAIEPDFMSQMGYPSTAWWGQAMTGLVNNPQADFMIVRAIIRDEADKLGFFPTQETIEAQLKLLFTKADPVTKEPVFDAAAFADFEKKQLGSYGLSKTDLMELIGDKIRFERIRSLVTDHLPSIPSVAQKLADLDMQEVDLTYTVIDQSRFSDKIEISEEQIKSYWEENRKKYLSEEQRRISWAKISLADTFKLGPPPVRGTLADNATEVQKQEVETKYQEELKAYNVKKEELDAITFNVGEEFWNEIVREREGTEFFEVIKNAEKLFPTLQENLKKVVITTGETKLFTKAAAPAELNLPLDVDPRSKQQQISDFVFDRPFDSDPSERVSDQVLLKDGAKLLFRVEEVIKPVELPFEKARTQARADLQAKLLREKTIAYGKEITEKLTSAAEKKENLEDILTKEGLKISKANKLSQNNQDPALPRAQEVLQKAKFQEVNQTVEKLELENEGLLLFYTTKRQLADSPDLVNSRQKYANFQQQLYGMMLFNEWLRTQYRTRQVEYLGPKS